MSKKRPGQNQINLTNIFYSKKASISTPYFTTKMDSISKMNSNLRKLYLPAISRKVIPKIQVSSIKLVKSHSQENFNISIDNNQLEHNKQNCQYNEKEKLLFLKLTISRIEAKINDLMINYKKLLNEKNQNLKAIKEIINSNNSSEKEILLNKIQYILENSNRKTFDTINFETIEEKYEKMNDIKDLKNKNSHRKLKINISRINEYNDKQKNNNLNPKEEIKEKQNEENNIINEENKQDKKYDKIIEEIKEVKEELIEKENINNEQINKEKEDLNKIIEEKNNEKEDNNIKEDNKGINEKEEETKESKKNKSKNKRDKKNKMKKKEEVVEYIINKDGMIEELRKNRNSSNNDNDSDNKKEEENNKEIKIDINPEIKIDTNQEIKKEINQEIKPDINQDIKNINELIEDNMIKINTISQNNSNLNINNNNNNNEASFDKNIDNNNSVDEQMNLKDIIEVEKYEDNFNPKDQSGVFGKSFVFSKIYNKAKIRSELSILKHQIINIQQKIRLKDEEIEEIKSNASMKGLIFKSHMLNKKMIRLQKIKTKNYEIENSSIPLIQTEKGLKNELEYYTKKNKSFISQNKNVEENYLKMRNEYEENNKSYGKLEIQNDRLKYKYNSLRLKDVQKQNDLDNLKKKINQIESIKLMLESDKKIRDEKKKEIEDTKKLLEEKFIEHENIKENKDKRYHEMNKLQKEIHYQIGKQKNEINKIQKDIKEIDKKILLEIDKYQHITKNNKKFINLTYIYKIKNQIEFIDYLQKLEKEQESSSNEERSLRFQNLLTGEKINFYRISKIKKKPSIKKEQISTEQSHVLDKNIEYIINSNGDIELVKDENEEKKEEKKEELKEENIEEKLEEKKEVIKEKDEMKEEIKEEKKEEKKEEIKEEKREDKEEKKEEIKEERVQQKELVKEEIKQEDIKLEEKKDEDKKEEVIEEKKKHHHHHHHHHKKDDKDREKKRKKKH